MGSGSPDYTHVSVVVAMLGHTWVHSGDLLYPSNLINPADHPKRTQPPKNSFRMTAKCAVEPRPPPPPRNTFTFTFTLHKKCAVKFLSRSQNAGWYHGVKTFHRCVSGQLCAIDGHLTMHFGGSCWPADNFVSTKPGAVVRQPTTASRRNRVPAGSHPTVGPPRNA